MSRLYTILSFVFCFGLVVVTGCECDGTTPGENACDAYTACPAGQKCVNGKCVAPAATCSVDADCKDATKPVCTNSVCVARPVSGCQNDTNCPAGQKCTNGSCVASSTPAVCTSDADCKDATKPVCQNGACVAKTTTPPVPASTKISFKNGEICVTGVTATHLHFRGYLNAPICRLPLKSGCAKYADRGCDAKPFFPVEETSSGDKWPNVLDASLENVEKTAVKGGDGKDYTFFAVKE